MKELVCINQQPLQVKEFKGQRVVTFKDIDGVHKRAEGTASRNFKNNRDRFIENVDYFIVKNSIDEFRPLTKIPPKGITLVTQSGYLMLVKSFNDDLAWQVQRELVNKYFKSTDNCIEELPKQLKEYNYRAKYYNGIPVVTISDISHFTHLNHSSILYHIKNNRIFRKGRDYYYVDKCKLAKFKLENAGASTMANSLYLVTKSGYDKLAKIYKQLKNLIEFKTTEVSNINVEIAQEEEFDLRVHEDAIELFNEIRKKISAIEQVNETIANYCLGKDVCHDSATVLNFLSLDLHRMTSKFNQLECLN